MKLKHTFLCIAASAFLAASPAAAQEKPVDTLVVKSAEKTVVILAEDGDRVHVISEVDKDGKLSYWFKEIDDSPIKRRRLKGTGRHDFGRELVDELVFDVEHLAMKGQADALWRSGLAKLESEARSLSRMARRADGDEKERLESDLRDKLDELFALKQQLEEERIAELREELVEAERVHSERQQLREEIIRRRLNELLGVESKYDW